MMRPSCASLAAGFLLAAGLLSQTSAAPVTATPTGAPASATTRDFVAGALAAEDFVAAASRIAAGDRHLRAFARRAEEQATPASEAFVAWALAERRAVQAADFAPTIDRLGPVFGAIDRFPNAIIRTHRADPRYDAELARLEAPGADTFDDLYVTTQVDALRTLVATYADYILNGDDTTLRALSVRELPKARRLLAAAARLRR